MPDINVSEPKIELGVMPIFQLGDPVAPAQVRLLPKRGMSALTLWLALKAALIVASSCGKGTRLVQTLALQLPPLVPLQVCAAGVVKVMPLLPPQSPEL